MRQETELIRISKKFKQWLNTKKLVPGESYEHAIKRLMKKEGEKQNGKRKTLHRS